MKLSNIFLSTLAVLLCCTACSKDEESFKGKDADASLSIAVKAVGSAVTKGFHPNDENELAGEAKVNNLSVLVFDESGAQLIGYGWQATNSEGEASILNVPAMTMRAQIVIVSNTPENSLAGVTSYSDFESKLAQLADQSQSNLVMSSPVITTQAPLVKGDNYLGYASMGSENINGIAEPVEITRLAARLDLVNVKTDFTKTLLRNRTVRVEEVTILNQSTASRFFSFFLAATVSSKTKDIPTIKTASNDTTLLSKSSAIPILTRISEVGSSLRSSQASAFPTITGYNIYRNGSKIGNVPNKFITQYIDKQAPTGSILYQVSTLYGKDESKKADADKEVNVGNEKIILSETTISPTVFTDQVELFGNEKVDLLEVITLDGKTVIRQKNPGKIVYTGSLSSGIYIFRIHTDGKAKTMKAQKIN